MFNVTLRATLLNLKFLNVTILPCKTFIQPLETIGVVFCVVVIIVSGWWCSIYQGVRLPKST